MDVLNIHTRTLSQPIEKIVVLLATLSSKNDKIWPFEKWPRMKFNKGVFEDSEGGHGPIRYKILKFNPESIIEFEFTHPKGFDGIHKLEIASIDDNRSELKHTIKMNTRGSANFTWPLVIRPLHDALIEDAFDKVENHFSEEMKFSEWSMWVKFLRKVLS